MRGTTSPADGGSIAGPPELPRRSRIKVVAALLIMALLVAFVFVAIPSIVLPRPPSASSGGGTVVQSSCPQAAGSSVATITAPAPNYDVQEVMAFTQSYSRLAVNVTAVAQCDASGYGPSYLLNGLTNAGFWYQVGIDWNWPLQAGGYAPGFGFVSEDWAPGGLTRAPPSIPFSSTVDSGDKIELSLSFSRDSVVASAVDLNTGASGSLSYPARGASEFVGSQAQQSHARFSFATQGYFTGLMTEWYHVNASGNGPGQQVTYSENTTAITSATLGVGEWNFTTSAASSVFSVVANNGNPIDFAPAPTQLQRFALNGYTLSADGFEFVTGS